MISVIKRWTGSAASPSDTNENTLATFTIPAGSVPDGTSSIQITCLWQLTNNANAKTQRIKLGSTTIQSFSMASVANYHNRITLYGNNSLQEQIGQATNTNSYSSSTAAIQTTTIDFTAAVDFSVTMQKGTGSDTATLRGYEILVMTQDELPTGKIGASLSSQPTYDLYTFTDGRTRRKDWK